MNVRENTREALRRHVTASFGRRGDPEDQDQQQSQEVPVKPSGLSGIMKRAIPSDYEYDPRALKPLARMLWALSVSLGHAMTAHRQFTKLKSATISPDGMIGGRGYVMSVKDVRAALHQACEAISTVSDTIHDELNAPHWRPKLAQLEQEDVESVERLVGDAERVLEDPEKESEAEEGLQEAEQEGAMTELEGEEELEGDGFAEDGFAEDELGEPDASDGDREAGTDENTEDDSGDEDSGDEDTDEDSGDEDTGGDTGEDIENEDTEGVEDEDTGEGTEGTGDFAEDGDEDTEEDATEETEDEGGEDTEEDDTKDDDDEDTDDEDTDDEDTDEDTDDEEDTEDEDGEGGDEDDEDEDDEDEDDEEHEGATIRTASCKLSERVLRRWANSSLPVETMAGPRVQHMDRADQDQTGPYGSYNRDEPQSVADEWSRDDGVGNDYAYESEWSNALNKTGESRAPSHYTDSTQSEAWDFGIGYGNGDDAHGQGAGGYGTKAPDGKGVYGPASKLPQDPGGKLHDESSDSTPAIEVAMGRSNMRAASWAHLPNDGQPGVARSDYYPGDKGSNPMNVRPGTSKMPGQGMSGKATPLSPRPAHYREHMFSSSGLPGEPDASYDYSLDVQPGVGYRHERDQFQVKWDDDTHNMRPDKVHQRTDEGPYVKKQSGRR